MGEVCAFRPIWDRLIATAINQLQGLSGTKQWDVAELRRPEFLQQLEQEIYEPVKLMFQGTNLMDQAGVNEFEKSCVSKIQVKMLVMHESKLCARELAPVAIVKPIFVVGMPRCGTTFLHNLLSQDSNCRSLKLWELHFPGRLALSKEARIKLAQERAARFDKLCPEYKAYNENKNYVMLFKALHHYDPLGPDECNWSLDNNFVDFFMASCVPRLGEYRSWLVEKRHINAYQFHKTVMQIAALETPKEFTHFACKSPAHFFWLNDLLEVFPDARVIWMHRDPVEALPSICKMCELNQRYHAYEPQIGDKKWLGKHLVEWMATEIELGMNHRDDYSKTLAQSRQFLDINFTDLLREPQGTIHQVYDFFGMPMPQDMEKKIKKWMQENPRDKYGVNTYTSEEYGLDETTIRARFSRYYARHIAHQRTPTPFRTKTPAADELGF